MLISDVVGMRRRSAIGNEQFLRSMIPHRPDAILMCRQAAISDQEILALCEGIKRSQQAIIYQTKQVLKRY